MDSLFLRIGNIRGYPSGYSMSVSWLILYIIFRTHKSEVNNRNGSEYNLEWILAFTLMLCRIPSSAFFLIIAGMKVS